MIASPEGTCAAPRKNATDGGMLPTTDDALATLPDSSGAKEQELVLLVCHETTGSSLILVRGQSVANAKAVLSKLRRQQ